jgi:hypothetical protein
MATDNTPPRLRLIVTIAVIVIITLVGVDFVLKSYYAFMSDEAQREKLAPLTARNDQRTAEQASFAGAKLPIDQAMAQVAKGTRSELIEPKPSEDMGPMTGWSKLPKQLPLPAPGAGHAAPMAPIGHDAMGITTDAGPGGAPGDAAHAADAGRAPAPHAPPAPAKDAGAAPHH